VRPVNDRRLAVQSVTDRLSLRETVADSLRAALVAGQMRPGVVYSVPSLAEQFGISPTPVREAMLDLAKEGLVEPVRNKGFRVTELTQKDLDDITQLRALIEVPIVAQLAAVADPAAIERLRAPAQAIVDGAEAGDLIAYVEADRQFHLSLLELAGNPHLVNVVRDLRARSRLFGLERLLEQERLTASALEHLELLDALLERDVERTEEIMHRHIGHVRGIWADMPEATADAEYPPSRSV
jgi:DNA-binding GntR family transcriptional regulator